MKISIVVPIYNVEKYLEKCVDSLINQTYKDIEIILVDDESPDNAGKICDEYSKKDNRIRVIHKKNGGLSDARNAGTEIATGDYILYVDSDDYIELDTCEQLAKIIENYKPEIVCFNTNNVYVENVKPEKELYEDTNTGEITVFTSNEAILDNLYRRKIRYSAWSKIYKQDIAKEILYPKGILAEDFATFYKFLDRANKIVYLDKKLYNYIHRENSIMGSKNERLYFDIFHTEKDYYNFLSKVCKTDEDLNQRENEHLKILFKIYAKLFYSKNPEYQDCNKEVREQIEKIDTQKLSKKIKLLYYIFKMNKRMFSFGMTKIYKKI